MAIYDKCSGGFSQMDDRKRVTCIWNPDHVLKHSEYQMHQLNECPDRPNCVFKCGYNYLHEFRSMAERDAHLLTCDGNSRDIRERKELEERKRKGTMPYIAPVVIEPTKLGESTDEWADEGEAAGVQDFRAPGLGVTHEEIEQYIESFDGGIVPPYLLNSMNWGQAQRVYEKQNTQTRERAANNKRLKRSPPSPPPKEWRQPVKPLSMAESSQEYFSCDESFDNMEVMPSISPIVDIEYLRYAGLGRGRGRPPKHD